MQIICVGEDFNVNDYFDTEPLQLKEIVINAEGDNEIEANSEDSEYNGIEMYNYILGSTIGKL